jgi:hypothetical protein
VDLTRFERERAGSGYTDVRGRPVVLFKGDWQLDIAVREMSKEFRFLETTSGISAALSLRGGRPLLPSAGHAARRPPTEISTTRTTPALVRRVLPGGSSVPHRRRARP